MSCVSGFIRWCVEHFTSDSISVIQLILTLGLAAINAIYVFVLYRLLNRKTVYCKRFNITIASMAVIVTAIIFTVQSDVVIALGVVGALSIVRFRTAIKDSLDIVFLFWAVTIGVCYGAHMAEIALILSALLTCLILGLDGISVKNEHSLLILEITDEEYENKILEQLRGYCKYCVVKTRSSRDRGYKIVVELKVKKEYQMIQSIKKQPGIQAISLIAHEGENNY